MKGIKAMFPELMKKEESGWNLAKNAVTPEIPEKDLSKRAQEVKWLQKRIDRTIKCPLCRGNKFNWCGRYVNNPVTPNPLEFQIGKECLPCGLLICEKCGFVCHVSLNRMEKLGAYK